MLEKWITPGLFAGTDAADEYTFMGTPDANARLTRHRDTWITEADFAWLAAHGIDAVRIPVGYWLLAGDPPYAVGAGYLDRAFDWAVAHGLKVLLDLHGLPGSQNGHDHSGRVGPAGWQKDRASRERSLGYLRGFAERYGRHPALWGIEVINEPNAGAFQLPLRHYYARAYRLLARVLPPHVRIVYADAWSPRIFAFALPFRRRAVMDVHLYHMATLGAKSHGLDWYYRRLRRKLRTLRLLARLRPMIIGEWSGVISGETIGRLSQADGDRLQQAHLDIQRAGYAAFAGTFYWTYKTEGSGINFWSYRSLVEE